LILLVYFEQIPAAFALIVKSAFGIQPLFGAILTPLAGNSYVYLNIIWSLGNIGNAIMAVPNLIGLLILAGTVAAVSRERL